MAICIHCGKPAGLFRRQHAACSARRQKAADLIPQFVDRYLSNPIPVERFRELLQAASEQSFISSKGLKTFVSAALTRFVNATLEHRIITSEEEARISQLVQAFEITMEGELFEQIVKSDILRSLDDAKIPERVQLLDPLPIELGDDEVVLWVFNRVESKRNKAADGDDTKVRPATGLPYFGRTPGKWQPAPKKLLLETTGDLVVTNHALHLISSEDAPRRIRFGHIVHLEPYTNALGIVSTKGKNDARFRVGRTITLDDPWFAANLTASLIDLSRMNRPKRIDLQSV